MCVCVCVCCFLLTFELCLRTSCWLVSVSVLFSGVLTSSLCVYVCVCMCMCVCVCVFVCSDEP